MYQAVARADVFSNPFSLAAQIAGLFGEPVEEVLAIIMAIVSGGVDWMRDRLRAEERDLIL